MENLVDLHLHSTYSDGVCTPQQLVAKAREIGLRAIAIADHDSVDGVDSGLAAGAASGVEVIPALELSVEFKGYRDVHLLGYCLDHRDPALLSVLHAFREKREKRGEAIVEKVNEKLKLEGSRCISGAQVAALAGGTLGRPHIAQVLIRNGLAKDMQDAFVRYLIPCDVPKRYFPIVEALALVKQVGGVAVLAHPISITKDQAALTQVIDQLSALGLDGVEAYSNIASAQESAFLRRAAEKRGLVWTGGTDYHGIEEGISIGTGRGGMAIPYDCVTQLKRIHCER